MSHIMKYGQRCVVANLLHARHDAVYAITPTDDADDDRNRQSCFLLLLLMSPDIINKTDPLPSNQPSMESTVFHFKLIKGSKAG